MLAVNAASSDPADDLPREASGLYRSRASALGQAASHADHTPAVLV
jgi:hypothetical protein